MKVRPLQIKFTNTQSKGRPAKKGGIRTNKAGKGKVFTKQIGVALLDEQAEFLERECKLSGIKSTEYMRRLLQEKMNKSLTEPTS